MDVCSRKPLQASTTMFRHTSVAVLLSILAAFGVALLSYYRASADFVAVMVLLVVSGGLFGLCWMATLYWVARVGIRPYHAFNDAEYESLGQLRCVVILVSFAFDCFALMPGTLRY